MKFLYVLLGLLLSLALSSASYPCGPHSCAPGQVCRNNNDVCSCVPINECYEVTLTQKLIGTWTDSSCGITYSQYDIQINNNLGKNIKNIFIGTDYTLKLREPASSNIWNIVKSSNGVLSLPSYQNSINAGASYVFGFIIEGTTPAHLNILGVTY